MVLVDVRIFSMLQTLERCTSRKNERQHGNMKHVKINIVNSHIARINFMNMEIRFHSKR